MNYELILVQKASVEEKKRAEDRENLKKLIEQVKGKVDGIQELGKKQLSFPVKKNEEGYYYTLNFSTDPKLIQKLTEQLRIMDAIIRFMIKRRFDVESIVK